MSTQTDQIIALALSMAGWVPPGTTPPVPPAPPPTTAWPIPINCVGGTPPLPIAIPPGDGDPTGGQGAPAYARRLYSMPDGSIGIFGDSILQMMHENLIHPAAVNYALGGQSLRRMINGLVGYTFMRTAGAGVMMCGVNDLGNTGYYGDRHQAALNVIAMYSTRVRPWLTGKWVICHLLPCDEIAAGPGAGGYNAAVAEVNAGLAGAMAGCPATIQYLPVDPAWVDAAGNLRDEYHTDGQHPSRAFCRIYETAVRARLVALGVG